MRPAREPGASQPGARPPQAPRPAAKRPPAKRPPGDRGAGDRAAGDRGPGSGPSPDREAAALKSRGAELRMAAALPGAKLRPILDAALAEVEAAADALSRQHADAGRGVSPAAAQAERRLLHAVFLQLPVPVFLLGQDRTIRRANTAAAQLLGSAPGYATGKQFTALIDMADRARAETQLANAFRTGQARRITCSLLSADGLVEAELTACPAGLRADTDQLIVAVTATGAVPAGRAEAEVPLTRHGEHADLELVKQLTRRLDLAADTARMLLGHVTVSESAAVQRCARLLVGELAGWVIVDVERAGRLRRQFVTGPEGHEAEELARTVAQISPAPGSVPSLVHASVSSQLITHAEDTSVLGSGPDDIPLVMLLGATSVLSVALSDGERSFGALTLVRQASHGYFGMADVAVAESVAEQLALAIRAGRQFRRHSAVAEAFRASLLPRDLPPIPGVEVAGVHMAAEGPDVGGDFYDVYQTPGGTGLAIGDLCGSPRDTVAVISAARHAIRVLARSEPDPASVLRGANDVLLGENLTGEFVTAHVARLAWAGDVLHLVLGSAGQPAPTVITADGQVRQLRGGGQPLGIFPDAEPSVQELDLSPGDVLFLLTDGVADARNPELGYFADRLADELAALAGQSASDIAASLRRSVLRFCDDEVRDDMTMLVLRVGDPPDDF
jgi:serine phosphatase RsbU (regulator of sigma subunit)/PAS domain-containing protein